MPGAGLRESSWYDVEVVRCLQLGASGYCRNCCDPDLHLWPVLDLIRTRDIKIAPA